MGQVDDVISETKVKSIQRVGEPLVCIWYSAMCVLL